RSLAAVELRTSTSQLNALPIFSQVGFMERLQIIHPITLKQTGSIAQAIIELLINAVEANATSVCL
ncbi:hypothetical protein, partial [Pseudomonas lundensis]|uniref:hypothetical protein n=1 Tax=Pseudomonas lundensis TaxID=86185 RepID=UPI001C30254B